MTREQAKRIALKMCKPFVQPFYRWIFPIIRNINPQDNLMDQLVAVQPMQQPTDETFYLDFHYDSKWERFKRWFRRQILRIKGRQFP